MSVHTGSRLIPFCVKSEAVLVHYNSPLFPEHLLKNQFTFATALQHKALLSG